MTWGKFELRPVSSLEAILSGHLSQGVTKEFALSEHVGAIALYSGNEKLENNALILECQHGLLAFSHAEHVLSLISDCPVVADNNMVEAEWFWEIYNASLPLELQELFGYLRPAMREQRFIEPTITITLQISVSEHKLISSLEMTAPALEKVLGTSGWFPLRPPSYPRWNFKIPLVVGCVSLALSQLKCLREGDVVVPRIAYFKPDGTGRLLLGKKTLGAIFNSYSASIEILTLEGDVMHEEKNNYEMAKESEAEGEFNQADSNEDWNMNPPQGHSDNPGQSPTTGFDQIMLNLSVRCGNINLTLDELGALNEGVILTVEGCQAGSANIYHGESLVGRGELVSIEGQLGVQVTKLYMDAAR